MTEKQDAKDTSQRQQGIADDLEKKSDEVRDEMSPKGPATEALEDQAEGK